MDIPSNLDAFGIELKPRSSSEVQARVTPESAGEIEWLIKVCRLKGVDVSRTSVVGELIRRGLDSLSEDSSSPDQTPVLTDSYVVEDYPTELTELLPGPDQALFVNVRDNRMEVWRPLRERLAKPVNPAPALPSGTYRVTRTTDSSWEWELIHEYLE
jgi:hypothetical protein